MSVIPKYDFSNHPRPDIIVIPGGWGVYKERKSPAAINWIRKQANDASVVLSVCNGAHSEKELFDGMAPAIVDDFTTTITWKDGMEELKISCPEKACLEMLNDVPEKISMEHADQLIQGMTTLSPRTLQKLLEQCTNIKVKRLFLWIGSLHNYAWYSKLKMENINLGSGNRMIVKGGELDKTFKITIPKNFQS